MSDDIDKTKPDGTDAVNADALKAENETLKAKLAELDSKAADLEAKFNEAKETRDKAKAKAREEAEKAGEVEKLKALYEEQLAERNTALEEHKAKLAEIETLKAAAEELAQYKEARRKELLELIPDDKREEFKDEPLSTLEKIVSILGTPPPGYVRGGVKSSSGATKAWKDMTSDERASFASQHTAEEIAAKMAAK